MSQGSVNRRQFFKTAALGTGCLAAGGTMSKLWGTGEENILSVLKNVWSDSGAYIMEFSKLMPGKHYPFKPAPEVFSFAEQMLHIAGANFYFMDRISGVEKPTRSRDDFKSEGKTPEQVSFLLKESFDYGMKVIEKMNVNDANGEIKFSKSMVKKWKVILFDCEHTAHHRGQVVIYLRLKGIKPPKYQSGYVK